MSFRIIKNDSFTKNMASGSAAIAMNATSSKGFSVWVNKDLREVEKTGNWSELMEKAEKQTKYFRNKFYRNKK
jgi:hypothetical protein